jgi:hypothetical protein
MKKYVDNMNQFLNLQHPGAECNCFVESDLDEEFMCDLCRQRLVKYRKKLKHKLRRETNRRFNKYQD